MNNYCRLALSAIASIIFVAIGTHARAQPVEYVRICDAYGSGFYYIPGTETCLKIGDRATQRDSNPLAMSNANAQFLAYLGSANAYSFGSDYDTTIFFGRAALGFRLPNQFRVQLDLQGEKSGSYCAGCGTGSHLAGAIHLNWNPVSNIDFGLFGGFADVNPTFFAPSSTFGFVGVEARYFTKNWMVGGQLGRLDLRSGTGAGTMTDAWFAEARAQVSIGGLFNAPQLQNLGIRATYGYASGKVAATSIGAESTQWSLSLNYKFTPTLSAYVGYHAFENRTAISGTVWRENLIKVGAKLDFGDPGASVPIEPMVPLPTAIGTSYKF